ncbi:hypothetical protein [Streptomyces phytohabitans]|uniref:hypothetical protein n=1 Tax=Streptomyces phytohabitans TaxID=1150371 RepID=UPI00345B85A0
MRHLAYVLGGLTGASAAGYFAVYLHRWEWQRALISGTLLLAVEVMLVCAVLLSRIARLERRLAESETRTDDVLRRLEQTRRGGPDAPRRFRWLELPGTDGTRDSYVFVPVLMATGAVLSGVAWVVQRVAAATGGPGAERRLARRLARLTAPPGGIPAGATLEERAAVPPSRPLRTAAVGAACALGVLLAGLLVGGLASATQTRPQARPASAATTVVFRVEVRGGGARTEGARERLAARELWESCRRATSVSNDHAALAWLDGDVWAGTVRPALTGHDLMRLRGCLNDATANRARAEVLGGGQAGRPPGGGAGR